MNNQILVRSAFKSILHHKGRSILTTLGINIGIASIIAMLAIGHGAEEKVKRDILAGGKNCIFIHSGRPRNFDDPHLKKNKQKVPKQLTTDDAVALKKSCPKIDQITPMAFNRKSIKYLSDTLTVQIKGGNENLITISSREIAKGTFFLSHHNQQASRVLVLGNKAAQELFRSIDPVGKMVQIEKIPFMVIGVLKKLEHQLNDFEDANLDSFVPFSTMKKYFEHTGNNRADGIFISAKQYDDLSDLVKQVTKHLRARHSLELKDPNDFMVFDQQSMLKAAQSSSNVLTIFLLIIACISLLVGGIGVMNIMLVSVGERTQEIGIRMALGAPCQKILAQFLYEALILCFFGGILGVLFGIAMPYITSIFTGWLVIIKPLTIFIAVIAILIVGLIFGYFPAYKASQLNPVDALMEK